MLAAIIITISAVTIFMMLVLLVSWKHSACYECDYNEDCCKYNEVTLDNVED